MQQHKQPVKLSNHVQTKLNYYRSIPSIHSSRELTQSDNISENNESLISMSPTKLYPRRSSTFVISPPPKMSDDEYILINKNRPFEQQNMFPPQQEMCSACFKRQNLLNAERQRLSRMYEENRRLLEQLRSVTASNQQYQEENIKLKSHLAKMNHQLEEYKRNSYQPKQHRISDVSSRPSQQDGDTDQLRRLRHELYVYKQVIAAKRQEEDKYKDHISYARWA